MSNPDTPTDDAKSLNFEAQYKALTDCVAALESGQLSLDDSLASYQRGIGLVQTCRTILALAQSRVEKLTAVDAAGETVSEPLQLDVETPEAMKAPAAKKRPAAAKDEFF